MKLITLLAALLLPFMAHAKDITDYEPSGWETVVYCATGDAVGGISLIWGASQKLYVSIDSLENNVAAQIYFTDAHADPARALALIRAGKHVTLVLRSDDSFDFGGETTHAALLNIVASKKQHAVRDSLLAQSGGVIKMSCRLKLSE